MDIITYSLSKKIAASAVSGVSSMSVDGTTLNIDTNDGQRLQMVFPQPKDGVSVTDIDVNANNQIVFTMSDGTEFISGEIPTVKGDKGDPFKYSDFTTNKFSAIRHSKYNLIICIYINVCYRNTIARSREYHFKDSAILCIDCKCLPINRHTFNATYSRSSYFL